MRPPPRRRAAWLVGLVVLAALAVAVAQLVRRDAAATLRARASASSAIVPAVPAPPSLPAPAASPAKSPPQAPASARQIQGIARAADGRPLPGATVTLYRELTAWPEWQRERLEQALVGADGAFRFVAPVVHGLLVGVEHPQHAEQIVGARAGGPPLDIRLAPGFALAGVVLTEAGAPLANARVAVESVVGFDRRARVAVTTSAGAFAFANLEAGPARLVARHPSWQPAVLPVAVVGEQARVELRVARPSLPPVRGVVVSVETRAPVPDALVELLPTNAQIGLADPLTARTGADGRFAIAGLGRGVMRLLVRHPDHGAAVRMLPVGAADAQVEVELPRRAALVVELDASRGSTLPVGATMRLRDLAGRIGFATVGADAALRFAGDWSPGIAELRAIDNDCIFSATLGPAIDVRIDEQAVAEAGCTVTSPFRGSAVVVDERGAPVPGAAVVIRGRRPVNVRAVGGAAVQGDLADFGRNLARIFTSTRDVAVTATDAAGAVAIASTESGSTALLFSAPGRATVVGEVAVVAAGGKARATTVVMPPAARLHGQVLRADRPFVGAFVQVFRGDELAANAVTDGAGRWSIDDLAPGDYRVRARNPAQASAGEFRRATAQPSGGAPLTLTLAPPRLVRGKVVARDSSPLAGAAISLRGTGVGGVSAVSAEDGTFAIEAIERGGDLVIARPDRGELAIRPLPANDELLVVKFDAAPSCTITATVAGLPGRRRLTGVLVRVAADDDDDGPRSGTWFDLVDGELRWNACPAGRVRVEVWSEGHAPFVVEREFEPGGLHDLGEIVLERGARLRGVVVGADGAAVAGAQVLVGYESDFELFEPTTRSGADGSFELTGVAERSSRLVVRAAGFAPRAIDLALPRDLLSTRPLQVALQAGALIEVVVDRELAGATGFLQVRRDGRFFANVEIDDAGIAVIADALPGRYEVALLGDYRPAKKVVLAPGVPRLVVQLP
ncbi:MAG: carboxypeptidase regulatory-like domain-containing protein [Planctomycetota bacterium]